MKILFGFLILLVVSGFIGVTAFQDNGYVLVGRGDTTIEMSLVTFIVLQILLYLFIAFTFRLLKSTWNLPDYIKREHTNAQTNKARKMSKKGLIALAQGQWKKAEKTLLKSANNCEAPLLNYLSAARAAQNLNHLERRDQYLALAQESSPEELFAVELTQAELQVAHEQYEQALATLVHLQSIAPKHNHVLNLLSQVYVKLNSWAELQKLLPNLKKHKVINQQQLEHLQKLVFSHLIIDSTHSNKDVNQITTTWKSIPDNLKNDVKLTEAYAKQLIHLKEFDRVESLLKKSIKNNWSIELISLYGLVESSHTQQQLDFAESLLKNHPHNPYLLLTLGRLCLKLQLWGKAQSYFEASLGGQPLNQTYKELGLLMEQLGDNDKASELFSKGLMLTITE